MSACIIACSIPAATMIPSPTALLQKTLLQALLWWRGFVTEQEAARQAKQQDWKSGGDSKRQRTGDRQVRSPARGLGISAKAVGALAQAPDTPPPMHLLRGSSSSGLLAVGPVDNRQVSVRVIELQAVVDAARRASSAAKQAKRICESAARACSSGAEVLDACVENFDRVIPSTFSSGL